MEFIEYAKCSTCKKAKCFLDSQGVSYVDRAIKDDTPSVQEITNWIKKYNIDVRKLFNTSGLKYRDLDLKSRLDKMSDQEKIELLASDGMLIKRPLLVSDENLLIGFKLKEWEEYFKNIN